MARTDVIVLGAGIVGTSAALQLAKRGLSVAHVDATVMLERSKLAPVRDQIRDVLSGAIGIAPEHVSVKATRGEGMGFVGREEGAAALAIATLATEGERQ